ncbi:MAG: hypothetical protein ABI977_20690, partial [Acidobacteriota bacterium]
MARSLCFRLCRAFAHLVFFGLLSLLAITPAGSALAQGGKSTAPQAQAPQPIDKDYTDSIVKNTTDKMFLTEFVDHLPASDKVPSPAK